MFRFRIIVGLLILLLGVAGSGVMAETADEIFARGNEAYGEGRYADALRAYESLLLYRVRDPRLEYNLAGTLFRLDRLGESILHYERARLLAPNDTEIRENLEYARSFCIVRVDPEPLPLVMAWGVGLQNDLGPNLHGWLALGLWWTIIGVIVVGFGKRFGWHAALGWSTAALLLLLLVVGTSWYFTWDRLVATQRGVILQTTVEALGGPGRNNATLFTVYEGLTVELRDERNGWSQVSLPNGLSGWLPSSTLEPI